MTKEARNFGALMAVLVTIALISFTVQSILEPELSDNKIELTGPISGNVVAEPDDVEGSDTLADVSNWFFDG